MRRYSLIAGLLCMASSALAQFVHNEDVIINGDLTVNESLFVQDPSAIFGQLCLGSACTTSETYAGDVTLRFRAKFHTVEFDDTSTVGTPDRDWSLRINDIGSTGLERFSIEDDTAGTIPFTIEGGAPNNALWVGQAGDIGIGTTLPQAAVHIQDATRSNVRFSTDGTFFPAKTFDVGVDALGFTIEEPGTGNAALRITGAVPDQAVQITSNGLALNSPRSSFFDLRVHSDDQLNALFVDGSSGRVGIGLSDPQEKLHIQTDTANTPAFALFEAAGTGSDAAFRLEQATTGTTWEFRNQASSGRLNVGIAGGNTPLKIDDQAANNLLKLGTNTASDAVVVTGRLLVNNMALNVPDYVFDEDFDLRPLTEVSAFIDANNHLPDVPSAAQMSTFGVDMTQMQMVLLQKVEELTLYTLQQENVIAQQRESVSALHTRLAQQDKRLDTMTDLLQHLTNNPNN